MNPTARILQFFGYDHLPAGPLRDTSEMCYRFAHEMADQLESNAETTTGLRKLLEAKDCFVRSHLDRSNE